MHSLQKQLLRILYHSNKSVHIGQLAHDMQTNERAILETITPLVKKGYVETSTNLLRLSNPRGMCATFAFADIDFSDSKFKPPLIAWPQLLFPADKTLYNNIIATAYAQTLSELETENAEYLGVKMQRDGEISSLIILLKLSAVVNNAIEKGASVDKQAYIQFLKFVHDLFLKYVQTQSAAIMLR